MVTENMASKRLYLDYNATAPLLDVARAALMEAMDVFGNPSSVHQEGRVARAWVAQARRQVAELVGAQAEHVVFTSGASEAATTLLTPHYRMGRTPLFMSHLYIGATEHPCMTAGGRFPADKINIIPVHDTSSVNGGLIDANALQQMLHKHDKTQGLPLVAIQYANHETGILQPMEMLAEKVKQAGGILIVDAVQAVGKAPLTSAETYGDFTILTAHKIGGPKGVGAFIASGSLLMPEPLITGGGQERGHRSGTQPVALIAAFGAAAQYIRHNQDEAARLLPLRNMLEAGIRQIAPQAVIYGEKVPRLANCCFFSLPEMKAETLQIAFDLAGIAVSSGSACSSGKVGTSAVLQAMGVKDDKGALRVSMGAATTPRDIEYFLHHLAKIVTRKK